MTTPRSHRVAVTGLGTLNPLANNVPDTWDGLVAGRSGIATIVKFDPSPYETQFAGEVKNFKIPDVLDYKEARA